nr:unnamed protein product [Digitaria exilis]
MASSGAAAAIRKATASACIVLLLLLPMAPSPVMGDCYDSCRDPCFSFADGFCGVGNDISNICPPAGRVVCSDIAAFEACDAACVTACNSRQIVAPVCN